MEFVLVSCSRVLSTNFKSQLESRKQKVHLKIVRYVLNLLQYGISTLIRISRSQRVKCIIFEVLAEYTTVI